MEFREDTAAVPDAPAKRQKVDDNEEPSTKQQSSPDHRPAWDTFLSSTLFLQPPEDLYSVFALASEIRPESPCDAFVETLALRLTGPFDILARNEVVVDKPLYLHGRFFFDPPEVATVLIDTDSDVGRHWGYFRDAPDQVPDYVVCAESSKECKFDISAGSLFQVLEKRIEKRRSKLDAGKAAELLQKIKAHRNEKSRARGQSESALRSKRAKDSVAPSLHQLGIVVPVDSKNNTGYRELPTTGKDLVNLLQQLEQDPGKKSPARKKLSDLVTRATIASDECDFGTGLLLGLDVFTAGSCLEKEALQLLRIAYMLLRRGNFYKIASGHCKHRN
ncbi:Histone PARylation factor 1 [Phytophthora citrophthora]|uniref:Histone PARylation factor 1 n=1 Tax=Phytophthora citrophthora TaxID=4793 RepID=A0AAD9LRY7_9STRA|nr:Histone PARylation factor 1 [Phytophthora citrophthora]